MAPATTLKQRIAGEPQPLAFEQPQRQRAGLEDLYALVAFVQTQDLQVPDLNVLVAQPAAFDSEDWDLASSSLGLAVRFDVVPAASPTDPEDLVRVAAIMRPDVILLDWRTADANATFEALREDVETGRIPVMIISGDGEQAAPRMLCGVWEDPAPEEFDDVVHLLDAINTRTLLNRVMPHSDSTELDTWFRWLSQALPELPSAK